MSLIRKAMIVGIGAVDLMTEKVEQFADELVRRGEAAEGNEAKLVKAVTARMVEEAQYLKKAIDEAADKAVEGLKGKEEEEEEKDRQIAALTEEIRLLRLKLEELEKRQAG